MLIISQNLSNYDVVTPSDSILRINLAWIEDLDELKRILKLYSNSSIFLDLPIKRTKPPNNRYTLQDISKYFYDYDNIKYFAISNVESESDLAPYLSLIPKKVILVPKIESEAGIKNIIEITQNLGDEKVLMLDHDDLYSSLLKAGKGAEEFQNLIKELIDFCDKTKVKLLRTVGVIFSDDEKRHGGYVN